MTADRLVTPLPQIDRHVRILDVVGVVGKCRCHVVEVGVLMHGQSIVEADVLVNEILPAVELAMDERSVLLALGEEHLTIPVNLLVELRCEGVKSLLHLHEDDVQSHHAEEHIVGIAEHHIVGSGMVKACVSRSRNAPMLFHVVFNRERI